MLNRREGEALLGVPQVQGLEKPDPDKRLCCSLWLTWADPVKRSASVTVLTVSSQRLGKEPQTGPDLLVTWRPTREGRNSRMGR